MLKFSYIRIKRGIFMIKAVLFDLDGTLINTNELIIESFEHTFEILKNEYPDRNEIISWFGEPLFVTMSKFFDNVDEAVDVYRKFNLKYHDERISIYDNTQKMLGELNKRGCKAGIVTSKNKSTALRALELLEIKDYFNVIVTSDDVKNHKPHKEPVLSACNSLSVSPEEALMVGDSIYDIISGRDAGSKTCGVLYSFMKDKILEMNADYYIENLIEILDII